MKKTLIITTLLGFLMCGCSGRSRLSPADQATENLHATNVINQLTYVRDERTKICYAVYGASRFDDYRLDSIAFTEVSCNKAFQDPNDPICGDPVEFKKNFPANANTHKH